VRRARGGLHATLCNIRHDAGMEAEFILEHWCLLYAACMSVRTLFESCAACVAGSFAAPSCIMATAQPTTVL
jgi:hypothetical protein